MAWNEPGNGKDPWKRGDNEPNDLDQIVQNWQRRLGGLLGGGGTRAPGGAGGLILIVLLALAWVTTGIYRYIRHPQYTGIFLFTLGWILHWPSVITLILWPVLTAAYVWLALFEERQAREEFGSEHDVYARRTKRFLPGIV